MHFAFRELQHSVIALNMHSQNIFNDWIPNRVFSLGRLHFESPCVLQFQEISNTSWNAADWITGYYAVVVAMLLWLWDIIFYFEKQFKRDAFWNPQTRWKPLRCYCTTYCTSRHSVLSTVRSQEKTQADSSADYSSAENLQQGKSKRPK